ncbi:MAG: Na+/H+ antiporter subunit B [Flavobacteriales bacterium]|nr:Na+/H+ antiporter subunit B [Flavobacteriales bacterium]
MNTMILRVAVQVLFPLLLVASLLSLFRGHNEPGGGFIGGLVAASAFILVTLSGGVEEGQRRLGFDPLKFIGAGLTMAFIAALIPVPFGYTFFEALWADFYIPIIGKPGTPVLFDLGVYFVVIGVVCKIVFSIANDD